MEKIEKWSEKKAQIQAEKAKKMGQLKGKGDKNMEKVNENAAKVNENSDKKEKVMKNEAIIDDRTEETKAKTRKMNKKGGDKKKKPAKTVRKPQKKEKDMTNKELLVNALQKIADKGKNFTITEVHNKSGDISAYQLKKDGVNVVSVRNQDVLVFKPVEIFSKTLQNAIPSFKKNGKRKDGSYGEIYGHYTHIRHSLDPKHLVTIVNSAVKDKKSTAEWMKKLDAAPKAYASKKTEQQRIAELQESIKRQQEQLNALKAAKKKVAKTTKPKAKKAVKKGSNVIAKVAETVA